MPIPTSRTNETARVIISEELCNGCGLCVDVCKDFGLLIENGKVKATGNRIFGCIACAHCMMICPHDAIKIDGRFTSADDLFELPKKNEAADYTSLLNLLKRRRAIREFKDIPVPQDIIDKIIAAAKTAPMGLPPSDVNVLVLDTKEKGMAFAKDYCDHLKNLKWMVSKWSQLIMKPFMSKANNDMFRDFLKPLIDTYTAAIDRGENVVTYDAPLTMYFYGSPYTDPADPIIAATYAMITAESLGLGTCMIGGVHPFTQNGKSAAKFRAKQNIKFKSREGLIVIMGYPRVKYHHGITRTFASIYQP
jgi:nitroreductase/NAD-dependent dihydropyrimidine dehydrogenase PreA subunit